VRRSCSKALKNVSSDRKRPIGFADFKGNRQLVSTGNPDITDRVALFMMDYSIALQRDGEAGEIADFVAYLTSPGASVIPSASTAVDGACAV